MGALRRIDNRLLGSRAIGWISVVAAAFFLVLAVGAGAGMHNPVLTVIDTVMSVWFAYWGARRLHGRQVNNDR